MNQEDDTQLVEDLTLEDSPPPQPPLRRLKRHPFLDLEAQEEIEEEEEEIIEPPPKEKSYICFGCFKVGYGKPKVEWQGKILFCSSSCEKSRNPNMFKRTYICDNCSRPVEGDPIEETNEEGDTCYFCSTPCKDHYIEEEEEEEEKELCAYCSTGVDKDLGLFDEEEESWFCDFDCQEEYYRCMKIGIRGKKRKHDKLEGRIMVPVKIEDLIAALENVGYTVSKPSDCTSSSSGDYRTPFPPSSPLLPLREEFP